MTGGNRRSKKENWEKTEGLGNFWNKKDQTYEVGFFLGIQTNFDRSSAVQTNVNDKKRKKKVQNFFNWDVKRKYIL